MFCRFKRCPSVAIQTLGAVGAIGAWLWTHDARVVRTLPVARRLEPAISYMSYFFLLFQIKVLWWWCPRKYQDVQETKGFLIG